MADDLLYPLRFFVVLSGDGVVVKRGSTEVAISGAGAVAVVEELTNIASRGATATEICEQFEPEDRAVVAALLDGLVASRLFVRDAPSSSEAEEGNLDVWYWEHETTRAAAAQALNDANLVVVGLNGISEQLARSLRAVGARAPRLVRDARFDDRSMASEAAGLFDTEPGSFESWLAEPPAPSCVVATSPFGNLRALLDCNRACLERQQRFLPVWLQNSVGYVGPLVLPGETACLDCARTRWNAGLDDSLARAAVDDVPPDAQRLIGFHPAMASMLGDLAALELSRFFVRGLPLSRLGTHTEMHMLAPRLNVRPVLKLPRCPSCSPLKRRASVAVRRA